MNELFDICVIGGGPAGSTTAIRLAEMGYSVCLIEAEKFPRDHHGICLSDDTNAVLDYIGVRDAMNQAAFLKRKVTVVKWEKEEPILAQQPGFHVDRGIFDQILLEKAEQMGIQIIQPAKAKRVVPEGETWEIHYQFEEETQQLSTRFLVEASGHHAILPAKKIRTAPPLFATSVYWELKAIPTYDGFIEAGEDAWLWFAKVNGNKAMITLFTDPKHFSNSTSETLEEHYRKMFQQFTLLNYCELGEPVSEFKSCDASSRYSSDPVGTNYIRVGDANLSVDPIASQGVHLAMTTALQAAVVVNTLLKKPENAEQAIEFYQQRQQERVIQFTQRTAEAYEQVTQRNTNEFWKIRAAHQKQLNETELESSPLDWNAPITLSEEAELKPVPVLVEAFIDVKQGLYHPNLSRPVAYLGGCEITAILDCWENGISANDFVHRWSSSHGNTSGRELLNWLWQHRIVVPMENPKKRTQAEAILSSDYKL